MLFVGFMEDSFAFFCHYWRPFVFLHISDYNRIDWCFGKILNEPQAN